MEFILHYFWLVNFFLLGALAASGYLFIQNYKKTNKISNWRLISFIILFILMMISPVKIDSTGTKQVTDFQNQEIKERNQEVPPKVVDNTFEEMKRIPGITKEDLK